MTKKLLGVLLVALVCAGLASAAGFSQPCNPNAQTNTTGAGSTPALNGNSTCATFTIPTIDTLTQVDLQIFGDLSLANGTFLVTYSITTSGGNVGTFATTQETEEIFASGGSSSTYSWTNGGGTCFLLAQNEQDCFTTMSIPGTGGGQTYTSVTVTAFGTWLPGSSGFIASNAGSEEFAVFESFTYGPTVTTPEPASLMMIGGGLIALAVVARRKRKA